MIDFCGKENEDSTSFGGTDFGAVSAAISRGELSEWFGIGKGTRQGCNILPTEFNMYEEDIVRRTMESNQQGVVLGGRNINNLRYADGNTLLNTNEIIIRDAKVKMAHESKVSNVLINIKNTKLMVAGRNDDRVKVVVKGRCN